MSEDVPETPDKAVQGFIALIALGFACGGGDVILHGDIALGLGGFSIAALFSWAAYKWLWIKSKVGARFRESIASIATDARWWMVFIFLLFVCLNFPSLLRQIPWVQLIAGGSTNSTGRIAWNFDQLVGDGFFLNMRKFNDEEIKILGIQAHGRNTSKDPISEFDGVVRSDITNAQIPIYFMAQERELPKDYPKFPSYVPTPMVPTLPRETFGIPALADFDITTFNKAYIEEGKDGVAVAQFLKEFESFTVVLKYDGIQIEKKFSADQVKEQITRFEKLLSQPTNTNPKITRRPDATKIQLLPFSASPPAPPSPEPPPQPPAKQPAPGEKI